MAKLRIVSGRDAGREIELNEGIIRIGRDPSNEIQLSDSSVSGFHCELHVASIATFVHDLGSTNGTFVNHQSVDKHVLQTGDTLSVGEIDLVVELDKVNVAIPEKCFEEAKGAAFLEDGSPGCFVHRDRAAVYSCSKCENWWCADCVRVLKRMSMDDPLIFCPECAAPCTRIAPEEIVPTPVVVLSPAPGSFFKRLGDTLHLTRRK